MQLACCVLVSQVNAASNKLAVYLPSAPVSGATPWSLSEHEQASAMPSQLVALRAAVDAVVAAAAAMAAAVAAAAVVVVVVVVMVVVIVVVVVVVVVVVGVGRE